MWKQIKGYEGLYDISSRGEVRSYYSKRTKKICDSPQHMLAVRKLYVDETGKIKGVPHVMLFKNKQRKELRVKDLVREAFKLAEDTKVDCCYRISDKHFLI